MLRIAVVAALLVSGAALAQTKTSIALLPLTSSAPVFVGVDRGHFKAEGLEVELKFMQSAAAVPTAIASGDADFGVTGLTGGFYNLAGKGAVRIVASQAREETGFRFNAFIVSNKAYAEGLTRVDQFKGRSIGLTTIGSTFHYVFGRLAEKQGWQLEQGQLRALQTVPAMLAAVKGGQVDVIQAPPPTGIAIDKAGEGKLIGWVADHVPWQLGALFTAPKTIAERRPLVERFVRAYQKAAAEYDANFQKGAPGKDADALLEIIAKHTKSIPEAVKAGLPYIDPMARLRVQDIYDQIAWNKANKLVDAAVDAKTVVDLSFVAGHLDLPR
ncbi:MAG: ABC transporter substrate-binding protein [Alphaproteobacteria bacterium]|nr:ABC transporter substrate-binding protein [Alphaproteobacteria bacterium]